MARLTTTPPLRKAKGDASAASRGMPEIHRSTPHVIPADAGNQGNTKHAISPPFAPRRGTRAPRAGGCPKFTATPHPTTTRLLSLSPTRRGGSRTAPTTPIAEVPSPTTTCPLSREPFPSPSQGEIKRGSQDEGNRAAMGCGYHPNHPLPPITATTPSHTTPSFPSFPIFRILVQVFPKVPQFQNAPNSAKYPYFPTQHLTSTAHLY